MKCAIQDQCIGWNDLSDQWSTNCGLRLMMQPYIHQTSHLKKLSLWIILLYVFYTASYFGPFTELCNAIPRCPWYPICRKNKSESLPVEKLILNPFRSWNWYWIHNGSEIDHKALRLLEVIANPYRSSTWSRTIGLWIDPEPIPVLWQILAIFRS